MRGVFVQVINHVRWTKGLLSPIKFVRRGMKGFTLTFFSKAILGILYFHIKQKLPAILR